MALEPEAATAAGVEVSFSASPFMSRLTCQNILKFAQLCMIYYSSNPKAYYE